MPAIRFTKLVIEHTPLTFDSSENATIGQRIDAMLADALERGEVIHEVALAFEGVEDFHAFNNSYNIEDHRIAAARKATSFANAKAKQTSRDHA